MLDIVAILAMRIARVIGQRDIVGHPVGGGKCARRQVKYDIIVVPRQIQPVVVAAPIPDGQDRAALLQVHASGGLGVVEEFVQQGELVKVVKAARFRGVETVCRIADPSSPVRAIKLLNDIDIVAARRNSVSAVL